LGSQSVLLCEINSSPFPYQGEGELFINLTPGVSLSFKGEGEGERKTTPNPPKATRFWLQKVSYCKERALGKDYSLEPPFQTNLARLVTPQLP